MRGRCLGKRGMVRRKSEGVTLASFCRYSMASPESGFGIGGVLGFRLNVGVGGPCACCMWHLVDVRRLADYRRLNTTFILPEWLNKRVLEFDLIETFYLCLMLKET
jgi:hypothetical protein